MSGRTRNDAASRSERVVIDTEVAAIGIHRSERLGEANAPWSGIGLSGGGIRSATFCLGVLQALAEKDLLRRFDYISSVSGGGYIATSLQWWWGTPREDDDSTSEYPPSRYRSDWECPIFLTGRSGRIPISSDRLRLPKLVGWRTWRFCGHIVLI